jgi:hypothetical protein
VVCRILMEDIGQRMTTRRECKAICRTVYVLHVCYIQVGVITTVYCDELDMHLYRLDCRALLPLYHYFKQ